MSLYLNADVENLLQLDCHGFSESLLQFEFNADAVVIEGTGVTVRDVSVWREIAYEN